MNARDKLYGPRLAGEPATAWKRVQKLAAKIEPAKDKSKAVSKWAAAVRKAING